MSTHSKGDIISRYLFGKSLGLVSSDDFIERAEQMRSFTKGIWIAIHFQFIRNIMLALPRWFMAYLSNAWVKVLWVRYATLKLRRTIPVGVQTLLTIVLFQAHRESVQRGN